MEMSKMYCVYVQEVLSAFLDREEGGDEMEKALSHLYECRSCQQFFNAVVGLRNIAKENREPYPTGLDEVVMNRMQRKSQGNLFSYRLKLPAYVISAAAMILMAISFTFGFMVQRDVHQKEMNIILQAPPSEVVYGMPAAVVYPVLNQTQRR